MFTLNHALIGLLKQLVEILSKKRTKQQVIDIMAEAHARFEGFYIPGTIPEKFRVLFTTALTHFFSGCSAMNTGPEALQQCSGVS